MTISRKIFAVLILSGTFNQGTISLLFLLPRLEPHRANNNHFYVFLFLVTIMFSGVGLQPNDQEVSNNEPREHDDLKRILWYGR